MPRSAVTSTLADEDAGLLRPARALIGWMSDHQAVRALASGRDDADLTPEQQALVSRARATVAARSTDLDQTGIVTPLPAELSGPAAALRASSPTMFDEGWELALVDLSRVCAFQPTVHIAHAQERVAAALGEGWAGLAQLTVPVAPSARLRASFDEARNAWVIVSPNRNLRLIGRFTAPVPGSPLGGESSDTPGFGFVVTVTPSYLQVAEFGGRYILRDGYHRALGLLAAGVPVVPALVCNMAAVEQLNVPGALPQESFLGSRPPVLPDYFLDDVSVEVLTPSAQKMILIQGIEIDFLS